MYTCENWSLTLREEHRLKVQNYWVSGLRQSSAIRNTRKHNVPETGPVSVLR
jgi:hypothetical protein